MSVTVNGTTGVTIGTSGATLTFPDSSTQNTAATGFGFKNRIINGAMMIDQRNAGTEVNPAANSTYYLDRWVAFSGAASKFKIGQNAGSVTPPTGYINYIGLTSLSAYTTGTSESFGVRQIIEGLNIADLAWGTASAATVTLSFQVYSSLTGTFGGCVRNSGTRSYPFSYSISSANTWTTVSVTIPGDTSGTWLTTSGIGIVVNFSIGAGATLSGTAGAWAAASYNSATGAVSVVGTSGATFYITGVQLEKGSTATSFDYRPYGTELFLCQRYYFQYQTASNDTQEVVSRGALTGFDLVTYLPVTMRAAPTLILPSGSTYGRLVAYDSAFAVTAVNVTALTVQASNQSLSAIHLGGTNASLTFAQGQAATSFDTNNISVGLGLSAEL